MKKKESKYIEIFLAIYRCTVVITWEQNKQKIIKAMQRCGIHLTDDWQKDFHYYGEKATGVCMALGDGNTDILVWLKERPRKAKQYGVLYHELFHAVDILSDSHNLGGEKEARAFLYEYLVNEANRILWV